MILQGLDDGILSSIGSALLGQLQQQIQSITVETAFLPPITIDQPFAPNPQPSQAGAWLRPKLTLKTSGGEVKVAPYGEPPTLWPLLGLLAVGSVAFTAYAIYSGGARSCLRR